MSIKAVAAVTLGLLNTGCAISQTASAPSMEERIERGKAYVPATRAAVPQKWIDTKCNPDYQGRSGSLEQCADEAAAQLPAFDPAKPRYFGERYSPKEYRECLANIPSNRTGTCGWFALRRIESPYVWPYEHNKNFKWPDAPKEPVYRVGMSGEAYFQALCEKEAGQWVYRSVPNVQGYYRVRPNMQLESQPVSRDRYVVENPFEYFIPWSFAEPGFPPSAVSPRHFAYAEIPEAVGRPLKLTGKIVRYLAKRDEQKRPITEVVSNIESRYGLAWREIERPYDREHNIAGTEWAVVDLQTNEVLGLMRSFMHGVKEFGFERGTACPAQTRAKADPLVFVMQVIQPASIKR